jgi:glucose-1-phosphate adenylyltransferase
MGIYLFNRKTLVDALEKTAYRDFGREVFPASMRTHRVQLHLFDGYWEDIGTIKSFYEANLLMASAQPPFDMTMTGGPVYTRARFLPPSRIDRATIRESLVADGCIIEEGAVIENSIIGLRSIIGRNVTIRNSILMGNDFYELPREIAAATSNGGTPLGVGAGSHIEGAIIDKNCRIGCNTRVTNSRGVDSTEENAFGMIRDGIVVMPKGTTLPAGSNM